MGVAFEQGSSLLNSVWFNARPLVDTNHENKRPFARFHGTVELTKTLTRNDPRLLLLRNTAQPTMRIKGHHDVRRA